MSKKETTKDNPSARRKLEYGEDNKGQKPKAGSSEASPSVKSLTEDFEGLLGRNKSTPDRDASTKHTSEDHVIVEKESRKVRQKGKNGEDRLVSKRSSADEEINKGKWLQDHPWDEFKPDSNTPTEHEICESTVYKVDKKWKNSNEDRVDLNKIYQKLPEFIDEMKEKSTPFREIGHILTTIKQSSEKGDTFTQISDKAGPYVKEACDKLNNVYPKDRVVQLAKDQLFKTCSLQIPECQEENIDLLDCGYILKTHIPKDFQWSQCKNEPETRWVFIPSYRRAKIALLNWPKDGDKDSKTTHRILVVRPSEFDDYVKSCGNEFPVIRLPNDEVGVGYARYWIQKIALQLGLKFIWVIDDSLECFYEYHPDEKPRDGSYKTWRRRSFGSVFKRIEDLVIGSSKCVKPIAVMGPRQFSGGTKVNNPFTCKPPRSVVFLNLEALTSKGVYYRPQLKTYEDMIFGYECEQKGLKVFLDNRVHFQDHQWEDTGARTPFQQKKTEHIARTSMTPSGTNFSD